MDQNKTIQAQFEACAVLKSEYVALIHEQNTLCYRDLNQQANQIAHFLIDSGVGSHTIVGLYFYPGFAQIIALLAILKTGAAYLPLDISVPKKRLSNLLSDAKPVMLLTHTEVGDLSWINIATIVLDAIADQLTHYSIKNPDINIASTHLCYLIYTSGTLGKPKGVMIQHGNVYNTVSQMQAIFSLTDTDKLLLNVSCAFDPSVWLLFWPLSLGAAVVIPKINYSPDDLCQIIRQYSMRVLHAGPSLLRILLNQSNITLCHRLELILGGGESWQISDLKQLKRCLPKVELCNVYGPTEASIHATYWCSKTYDWTHLTEVPIGKPLRGMEIFIFDDNFRVCALGEVGELYLSGLGVGPGYWQNDAMTRNSFVQLDGSEKIFYKTGDLVKQRSDGNLVFVGRADEQIKLRGFRIELIEIEQHILCLSEIENVAIIAYRENDSVISQLIAFVVLTVSDSVEIEINIKRFLKENLPDYMIPHRIIALAQLPMTLNHKIDKSALYTLYKKIQHTQMTDQSHTLTALIDNSVQAKLTALWSEILNRTSIAPDQHFFDIGGDSLSALALIGKINQQFAINLSVVVLFEQPTISALAKLIKQQVKLMPIDTSAQASLARWPLSDNQKWLLRTARGFTSINNIVLPLRLNTFIDEHYLEAATHQLIKQHPILRATIVDNANVILQKYEGVFNFLNLENKPHPQQSNQLDIHYLKLNNQEINLNRDSLFKIQLIRCSLQKHILYIFMHHVISDPFSAQLLLSDLLEHYLFLAKNRNYSQDSQRVSLSDYLAYEQEIKSTIEYYNQLVRWKNKVSAHPIKLDFGTMDECDLTAACVQVRVPYEISVEIKAYCHQYQISLFVFLLSAFKLCLYQCFQQERFGVGINISRRTNVRWSKMVGPLSEQAISLVDFSKITNFSELIQVTNANLHAIYAVPVSIESICQELYGESTHCQDMFNVLFDYERSVNRLSVANLDVFILPIQSSHSVRRHLSVRMLDDQNDLILQVRHRKKLFTTQTIDQCIQLFFDCMAQVCSRSLL